jgi:hypothetical protein
MNPGTYDPTFFDRVMTQSPMPIWEEVSESATEMDMEPDQERALRPISEQIDGGGQYAGNDGGPYLVGPASGAEVGIRPGPGLSIGMSIGGGVGSGDEILNADGVIIGSMGDSGYYDGEGGMVTDPNSPDKFGEGILLPLPTSLPER